MDDLNRLLANLLRQPAGSTFGDVDLHIHTPASLCSTYRRQEYQAALNDPAALRDFAVRFADDLLDAGQRAGYRLIALTDHNSPGYLSPRDLDSPTWYELICERARVRGNRLVILPGVELTLAAGVHMLALFPPSPDVKLILAWLLLQFELAPADWGRTDAVCPVSPQTAMEEVARRDGLSILAHIDGAAESSFYALFKAATRRQKVLDHPALSGVEVVERSTRAGVRRNYPELAVLMGSDNHNPLGGVDPQAVEKGAPLGSRCACLCMDWPAPANGMSWADRPAQLATYAMAFNQLRLALRDPQSRLRLKDDPDPSAGLTHLVGLHVVGGFAGDGERPIRFNDRLNVFVGAYGSGRSTRIRLLDTALGHSDFDPPAPGRMAGYQADELYLVVSRGDASGEYYLLYRPRLPALDDAMQYFLLKVDSSQPPTRLERADWDALGLRLPLVFDEETINTIFVSPVRFLDFLVRHFAREAFRGYGLRHERFYDPKAKQAPRLLSLIWSNLHGLPVATTREALEQAAQSFNAFYWNANDRSKQAVRVDVIATDLAERVMALANQEAPPAELTSAALVERVETLLGEGVRVRLAGQRVGVPLARLSKAERSLMMILILHNQVEFGPVVIDDIDLYVEPNRIYDTLLPRLRELKIEGQQVIMVSNDPNLVVAGNAEHVLLLAEQMERGALRSRVQANGGVESPAVRQLLLDTLEGSEAAFRRRGRLYGLME